MTTEMAIRMKCPVCDGPLIETGHLTFECRETGANVRFTTSKENVRHGSRMKTDMTIPHISKCVASHNDEPFACSQQSHQ